ncbi:unnamed protein product [Camellia sinensis]
MVNKCRRAALIASDLPYNVPKFSTTFATLAMLDSALHACSFKTVLSLSRERKEKVARERERKRDGWIVCSDELGDRNNNMGHREWGKSPPHGLICLANQCLVASQTHRQGSVAGGVIFIWPFNKTPVRSYTMESIGQITCTKDGTYIVGGAPSRNPYVWEVWDLVTGRLLQTRAFLLPITAIVVDPTDKKLFSGSADGTIFLNTLDFGVVEDTSIVLEDEPTLLTGHNGSITALTFCGLGLVSAFEDCTACLWDVVNCVIIRRFNHLKGFMTNLVVIPRLSLFPRMNHNHKTFNQFRVSVLDKYPKPANSFEGLLTYLLSSSSRDEGHCIAFQFRTTNLLKQQILELETGETTAAMEMMVETRLESEAWATRMGKHVMEMNKHLQSRLLDMMQCQLLQQPSNVSLTTVRRKRKITNVVEQGKEHHHHPKSQGS